MKNNRIDRRVIKKESRERDSFFQSFFADPVSIKSVDRISANPTRSISMNDVFSQRVDKTAAATGSLQAKRLALAEPIRLMELP